VAQGIPLAALAAGQLDATRANATHVWSLDRDLNAG